MPAELLVSRVGDRLWAALREEGRTVEFRVERQGVAPRLGLIVKGRVTHVVPALQAAFVDVGFDRDAFLHASDLVLPGETGPVREGEGDRYPPATGGFAGYPWPRGRRRDNPRRYTPMLS